MQECFTVKRRCRSFQKRKGSMCVVCCSDVSLTVDHIVPMVFGGTNVQSNLQTLCLDCNHKRSHYISHETWSIMTDDQRTAFKLFIIDQLLSVVRRTKTQCQKKKAQYRTDDLILERIADKDFDWLRQRLTQSSLKWPSEKTLLQDGIW